MRGEGSEGRREGGEKGGRGEGREGRREQQEKSGEKRERSCV